MALPHLWEKAGKYEWEQIADHVNAKHRLRSNNKTPRKGKGPYSELGNDKAVRRESDFGFIRITIKGNSDTESTERDKEFTCRKCGDCFPRNVCIIGHIARKRHELPSITDPVFAYCPDTFSPSATSKTYIAEPTKNSKQILAI